MLSRGVGQSVSHVLCVSYMHRPRVTFSTPIFQEIKNRCMKKKRASRASKRVEQEEKNAVLLFYFFVDESGERREI